MKRSRAETYRKAFALPEMRFEDQQLTSYSGLVVFQKLFAGLGLKQRLRRCFRAHDGSAIFGLRTVVLQLVVHFLLGYRELRHAGYYRDDPLVLRILGLEALPDMSTVSRTLAAANETCVERCRREVRGLVLERLRMLGLPVLTLDLDGVVQSTGRFAEGVAVGYNDKRRGQRSYYPLFCTVAQTGQVFDVLHRPGNVHDSNGANAFILNCLREIRSALPYTKIELRMDAAFFDQKIIETLREQGVEFTVSVPFARLAELKGMIEERKRWRVSGGQISYFEQRWKPKSWGRHHRFLFIRARVQRQQKGPIQLNLFEPYEHGFEFKVIVTNKRGNAAQILAFHNGRGAQEGVFAELSNDVGISYVPSRTLAGNQIYLLSALMAHNLARELQMVAHPPARTLNDKRTPLWAFQRLSTLCHNLIQRAGRLTRPNGHLTLTMSANPVVRKDLLHYLDALQSAA